MPSNLIALILLALASFAMAQEMGPPQADNKLYGQRLLEQFEVPLRVIKQYRRHLASQRDEDRSAIENTLFAKTVDWQSPEFAINASQNPHQVVLTVAGRARADGDVATVWLVGWSRDDGTTKQSPAMGVAQARRKAGERVILTDTILVSSFLADQKRAVDLGFSRAENLDIESVTMQIWSGVPESNWLELLLSGRGLLVGLGVFFVLWWLRR